MFQAPIFFFLFVLAFFSDDKTLISQVFFLRSQKNHSKHFSVGIALAKGTVAPDGSFRRTKNKPTNLIMKKIEAIIPLSKLNEVQDALGKSA